MKISKKYYVEGCGGCMGFKMHHVHTAIPTKTKEIIGNINIIEEPFDKSGTFSLFKREWHIMAGDIKNRLIKEIRKIEDNKALLEHGFQSLLLTEGIVKGWIDVGIQKAKWMKWLMENAEYIHFEKVEENPPPRTNSIGDKAINEFHEWGSSLPTRLPDGYSEMPPSMPIEGMWVKY